MRKRKESNLIPVHHYQIHRLIDGSVIDQKELTLIAVPDTLEGKKVCVEFRGREMLIEKVGEGHLAYRTFDDKFGRDKQYRLIYYEWRPMSEEEKERENAMKFLI